MAFPPSTFDSAWQPVYERHPVLKRIVDAHGDRSVYDYVQTFFSPFPGASTERREEWLSVFETLLIPRVGSDMAHGTVEQLRAVPLVSTADHHAPIDEPYWMNANLVHALAHIPESGKSAYNVCFSFASVSMNNALGYPRGLLLHEQKLNEVGLAPHFRFYPEAKLLKFSLFSDKDKMSTVYGFRPYQMEDLERLLNSVKLKAKEGQITPESSTILNEWISEMYGRKAVLDQQDYSSQITALNAILWPSYFDEKSRNNVPQVIYFDIETLVTELLLRVHLKNPISFFNRLIFDPKWQAVFVKEFEGVHGAFCSHDEDGTYYFWGLDDKGHKVRLFLKENKLSSAEGTIAVDLTAEAISEALASRKIFPCMALCYVMMAFYYRVRCLGATSQIRDLTRTKERWQKLLNEVGESDEAQALDSFPTEDLIGALSLNSLMLPDGDRVLPTGLDLLIHGCVSFDVIVENSQKMSLREAMLPYIKDLYNDFCRDLPFPLQDLNLEMN